MCLSGSEFFGPSLCRERNIVGPELLSGELQGHSDVAFSPLRVLILRNAGIPTWGIPAPC